MMELDFSRLEKLGSLKSGGHKGPDAGACIMEAVAYIADEPWSDHPQCVSPVIGAFLRNWNDNLPNDADRDRLLKPLIPKIINTRADEATEWRRSYLALDWMIRTYLPAWLRLAKLNDEADMVAALAPIVDMDAATAAAPIVRAAYTKTAAAWVAAWIAAGDAAGDAAEAARVAGWAAWIAAGDAAGAAAWIAAWDAAGAAGDAAEAAGDAAGDAAWIAAWDAAGDAAGDTLAPTLSELQLSAVDLVERMAALLTGGGK